MQQQHVESSSLSRILIIHTGGTFGMNGDKSEPNGPMSQIALAQLCESVPELAKIASINLHIASNLDSSDINPSLWLELAHLIEAHWDLYDGFVVIHGTDTLAYTASALSFLLERLTKSVVLTGAQRPLASVRNDARMNIIDAVELATLQIPEVLVCFDSQIHRGCRVTKYSNEAMHAFKSPNGPLLGRFGVHSRIRWAQVTTPVSSFVKPPPYVRDQMSCRVMVLTATPGLELAEQLLPLLFQSYDGFVLRAFGCGTLPIQNSGWKTFCEQAYDLEKTIILTSQCLSGAVSLKEYKNGAVLESCGVIPAQSMTFESATVKLMVMLGRGIPFVDRSAFFKTALARELD